MWRGGRLDHKSKDRTLAEIDKALAATATAQKADALVKEKQAHAKAAETRKTKLVAVLNSICDDCATIPCLMPATATTGTSSGACTVCGNSVDRVDPPRLGAWGGMGYGHHVSQPARVPSAWELRRELESQSGEARYDYGVLIGSGVDYGVLVGSKPDKYEAPTRKQMLCKADEFVRNAQAKLDEATAVKTKCDQQKQTLQQEQQQLLARLGGTKRGASDESCSICLSATKTHVLIPCGHKCMCDECARSYRAGSRCPICRGGVQSVVRVYD